MARLRIIWTGKASRQDSSNEVQRGVTLQDPTNAEVMNEVRSGLANGWRVQIYVYEEE